MKTIRFYTGNDAYKGWQKQGNTTFSEIKSWVLSGNYVKIDNERYDHINYTNLLITRTITK